VLGEETICLFKKALAMLRIHAPLRELSDVNDN
jgi:hypothetical protein